MDDTSSSDRQSLQREAEDALMRLPNVSGVDADLAANDGVIKVLVSRKLPDVQLSRADVVPRSFRGHPTDVIEIGEPESQTIRDKE
jgi:hypothetical protein